MNDFHGKIETDVVLSTTIPIKLIRKGTDWFEVGSNTGA